MKKEYKDLMQSFEIHARPTDMVAHIDRMEIINLLKEIRKELKNLNKDCI